MYAQVACCYRGGTVVTEGDRSQGEPVITGGQGVFGGTGSAFDPEVTHG